MKLSLSFSLRKKTSEKKNKRKKPSGKKTKMNDIFIEKYRPKSFEEVKGQENIVRTVKAFVDKRNLPHMMFAGPAGVGKTSLILVVARTLFGENWRQNFLDLNASDDRGIDVVRDTIKNFAKTKPMGDVPFKIIHLDECDSLTRDAQQALRRTMENFSSSTRFCLSCNYSSKIIDPIVSRCAIFRFQALKREDLVGILKNIADKENLEVNEEILHLIADAGEGDVRRAENIIQSCSALSSKITKDLVLQVSKPFHMEKVKEVLDNALKGSFLNAKERVMNLMLYDGFSALDIIKTMQKVIWELEVSDREKLNIIEKTAEIEFRIVEGGDEFIQIEALLASITKPSLVEKS